MSKTENKLDGQITETIKAFMKLNQPFTAYDVTLATRAREGIVLRHEQAREIVHANKYLEHVLEFGYRFEDDTICDWIPSTVESPNGQPTILYHPDDYDAKRHFNPVAEPKKAPQVKIDIDGDEEFLAGLEDAFDDEPDLVEEIETEVGIAQLEAASKALFPTTVLDYRHRLLITVPALEAANIDTSEAYIGVKGSRVLLSKDELPNVRALGTVKVDIMGAYVPKSVLAKAGFVGTAFVVSPCIYRDGSFSSHVVEIEEKL